MASRSSQAAVLAWVSLGAAIITAVASGCSDQEDAPATCDGCSGAAGRAWAQTGGLSGTDGGSPAAPTAGASGAVGAGGITSAGAGGAPSSGGSAQSGGSAGASGTAGAGGSSQSGGSAGASGTVGAGGSSQSGGSAGASGAVAAGGSSQSGGSAGTGGGTGAAGAAGSGASSASECNDGIDNDGDGLVDWQYDLGCYSELDPTEAALSRDQEAGWSTFDPSAASTLVYVSASGGDDARDGSSPQQAVQTLARGAELVRDGAHDFLLLQRGDTWRDESLGRFVSGQDATHPIVLASYGESIERPRIEVDSNFIDHNGAERSYVALVGLELITHPKEPTDSAYDGATGGGLRYVGGGTNLLIEDCHLRYSELVVQTYGDYVYQDVEIRRNVVDGNYHIDTCGQNSEFRPSGMYASHVQGLLIEGNLFDHNGWNEQVASACATMYNHNLYLNADDLVIRGNLILRASSMGIKMRSDATGDCDTVTIEDNLIVEGEIGIGMGGNTEEPYRFSNVAIRDNVFTHVGRSNPTDRSFAWMLELSDHDTTRVERNLFLNQPWYTNAYGIEIGGGTQREVVITENLFYALRERSLSVRVGTGWESVSVLGNTFADPTHDSCLVDHQGDFSAVTYAGNHYSSSAAAGDEWFCVDGGRQSFSAWQVTSGEADADSAVGQFVDPDRSVESYAQSLGLDGTFEGFIGQAAAQSRYAWRPALTAEAVNNYIRAGFVQQN